MPIGYMLVPHGSWAPYSPLVKQKGKRHAHHDERPHQQKKKKLVKIKKHDEKLQKNENKKRRLERVLEKRGLP